MALIRSPVSLVLVPALAAGCSQSLFDNPGGGGGDVKVPGPPANTWHFFRMVRGRAAGTVSVCVDAVRQGQMAVPTEALMPSSVPMSLGRRDERLADFRGALHDLRVFQQALPCPSVS